MDKTDFVNDIPVEMKVDMGADVTTILETIYRRILRSTLRLSKVEGILWGPDGKELSVLGLFHSKMSMTVEPNRSSQQIVYIV